MVTALGEALMEAAATQLGLGRADICVLAHREGRLVARTTSPDGRMLAVKASSGRGDLDDEAAAISKLSAAGLPVADVLALRAGPPSLIALTWTPGRSVSSDDDQAVRLQVVDLLSRVHALPAQAPYGGMNADLLTWVDGWIHHAFTWWAAQPGVTGHDILRARQWYDQVRPMIAARVGSLVLLDGVPDHFIVGPDATVRMIDVANLQSGDPVMDLAVMELHAPGIFTDTLDGYHQSELSGQHLRELLPFYVFLRALATAEWHNCELGDSSGAAVWLDRAAADLKRGPVAGLATR